MSGAAPAANRAAGGGVAVTAEVIAAETVGGEEGDLDPTG